MRRSRGAPGALAIGRAIALCAAVFLSTPPASLLAQEPPVSGALSDHEIDSRLAEARAACGLGESHFERGRYEEARTSAQRCLDLQQELAASTAVTARRDVDSGLGRAHHLLGIIAVRDGQMPLAREHAERAMASFEAAGDVRGRALATLQMLRVVNLGLERERPLYDRVIADARAVSDRVLEARALHSFGDLLFVSGQYGESLEALESAAALFEKLGQTVDLGTTYNSLGRLYRSHGRLDAALASQLKALALHEQAAAPFEHLQSLNAVAVTYRALGDVRRTREHFDRALALAKETSTPRIQDFLRANIASALLEEGDYQQAADLLEGVIARGLDAYPVLRMREAASAYLHLGRHDVALSWAAKAVARCGAADSLDCIRSYDKRAAAYAALGNDAAALDDLRTAMTAIETVRRRLVPADFLKQQFHLALEDLYSRTIAIQIRNRQAGDALETAEHARARAFVDLLASRDLGAGGEGGALRSDSSVPAASRADLVAAAARLRSTILAYWVAEDEVFVWVVTADGVKRATRVEVRQARLLELIRATAPAIDDQGSAIARVQARGEPRPARELYDLLIKPVRDALPRAPAALLTIVPHGPLSALSFAGLRDPRGRYLLEDYTLHYAPSGAALRFTEARRRPDARAGRVLLVADPVTPAPSTLDLPLLPLPGARAESRAIAALVPRPRLARFERDTASEAAVRTTSADRAVLHFATHAIVRDDEPLASYLALGASGDDDGRLTAQEIYGLRLAADLVVLSGCRSAGGRVTGDGVATFARAFIYAGAASVVASLWEVADMPTNRLVSDFYRAWLGGASKARALRAAQLAQLRALRARAVRIDTPAGPAALPEHAVFWAGFTLIGEPD